MKDLYSVSLDAKQIARALEEYVLRRTGDSELVARAQLTAAQSTTALVTVSTKRKPRDKTAEAKQARERG